jgi:DNA-binding MarR family transcriptional regulator
MKDNSLNKEIHPENTDSSLEERAQQLAHYLLFLRKIQDKADALLIDSLKNLSMQELNVLNIIGDQGSCIMSKIAESAYLSLSSITVIVDKLVKANLVDRIRSEKDRRIVQGVLTEAGQKIYQIQIDHLHAILRKLLNTLTLEEQMHFLKIFKKITHSLQMNV